MKRRPEQRGGQKKKQKLSKDKKRPEIVPCSVGWEVLTVDTWFCIASKLDNPLDLIAFEMTSKTFKTIAMSRWNSFAKDFFPELLPVLESLTKLSKRKKLFDSIWRFSNDHSVQCDDDVGWTCPVCFFIGESTGYHGLTDKCDKVQDNEITVQCEDCLELYKQTFKWTFDIAGAPLCNVCKSYGPTSCLQCERKYCEDCSANNSGGAKSCECYEDFVCSDCYKDCEHCADWGACQDHMEICFNCGLDQCPRCESVGHCCNSPRSSQ